MEPLLISMLHNSSLQHSVMHTHAPEMVMPSRCNTRATINTCVGQSCNTVTKAACTCDYHITLLVGHYACYFCGIVHDLLLHDVCRLLHLIIITAAWCFRDWGYAYTVMIDCAVKHVFY